MRHIKSRLAAAIAFGALASTAAIAKPAPDSTPVVQAGECVVVPGYKGRWHLQEGQWYRCRKSGAGVWVPAGSAALAAGVAGGAGAGGATIAAGVGVLAAAGIGIAASGGDNSPASP